MTLQIFIKIRSEKTYSYKYFITNSASNNCIMSKYNKEYFGNDRWEVVPDSAVSAGPTLFTIVFVSGIVIFILILIGR